MAAASGTVTLPVQLSIGDSSTLELGTVEVPVRIEGMQVRIDPDGLNLAVAGVLERSAAALREGGTADAASAAG